MFFRHRERVVQEPSVHTEPTETFDDLLAPLPDSVHGFGTSDIVKVVGVMTAQDLLGSLASVLPYDPVGHQRFDVALVREPENVADVNAVAVYLASHHLGYLPRDEAKNRQALIVEAEQNELVLLGDAMLVGGGDHAWGLRVQIKPNLRNKRGEIHLADGTRRK